MAALAGAGGACSHAACSGLVSLSTPFTDKNVSVHTTVSSSLVKSHVTECVGFAARKRLTGRSELRCAPAAAEEELALADSLSRSRFTPFGSGSGLCLVLAAEVEEAEA